MTSSRGIDGTAWRGLALAVLACALAAPSAEAAGVGAGQPDPGTTLSPAPLVYRAGPSEVSDLEIADGAGGTIVFTDRSGRDIEPGEGCMGAGPVITCTAPAAFWLYVLLGDGDDDVDSTTDGPAVDMRGAGGDDRLRADQFALLDGGAGADRIEGAATYCCTGPRVSYGRRTEPVTIRLSDAGESSGNGAAGEDDTIGAGIESAEGGQASDVIEGDGADNTLLGWGGDDTIAGGDGDDALSAWGGRPTLAGGGGEDSLFGGTLPREVSGGADRDLLGLATLPRRPGYLVALDDVANDGPLAPGARAEWHPGVIGVDDLAAWVPLPGDISADVEDVAATDGADVLLGSDEPNIVEGRGGRDTVVGGGGGDWLMGSGGDDTMWARDGEGDLVDCGTGHDRAIVDDLDTTGDCEDVYAGDALPSAPAPLGAPPADLPLPDPVLGFPGPAVAPAPAVVVAASPPPVQIPPIAAPPRPPREPSRAKKPIVLTVSRKRIRPRQRIKIAGVAPPLARVTLDADYRLRGRYRQIASTVAGADGRFKFRPLRPSISTAYLVRVGGQVSPIVAVEVKRPKKRSR